MRNAFFLVSAAAALTTPSTSVAALTITSAERSIRSSASWTALIEQSDAETVQEGPVFTDGQWDAVADADPNDVIDRNNRIVTAQSSFIGSTGVSAAMSTNATTWPVRPSLGYVTLFSQNVFEFTFSVAEPTPIELTIAHVSYLQASVLFRYSLRVDGGAYILNGASEIFYNTGESFAGILEPGEYTFVSEAEFSFDGPYAFSSPMDWFATIDLVVVPAPGCVGAFAVISLASGSLRRRLA